MSGIYNHRPMVPGRSAGVPEWLDLIKQEFETLSHEAMIVKAQRDECEHRSKFFFFCIRSKPSDIMLLTAQILIFYHFRRSKKRKKGFAAWQ